MRKIQFIIGDGQSDTPIDGDTFYSNKCLNGKDILFFKVTVGPLFEGRDFSMSYKGGIQLLNGATFSDGEAYTILILE